MNITIQKLKPVDPFFVGNIVEGNSGLIVLIVSLIGSYFFNGIVLQETGPNKTRTVTACKKQDFHQFHGTITIEV